MTADTTRAELLAALAELGKLFPDWRMGQTLANLAMAAGHPETGAIFLPVHPLLEFRYFVAAHNYFSLAHFQF